MASDPTSSPPLVNASFLPDFVAPERMVGATVVVIDVLRASTVIAVALAAGAKEILPCLEVEEARARALRIPPELRLLGGERGGMPIQGFDLGNSPDDYTAARVAGKTIIFTTTNGTRAMQRCHAAARVLVGAFVNQAAIVRAVAGAERVELLCAGTGGEITREDVLFAGAVADELRRRGARLNNDEARIAVSAWREIAGPSGVIGEDALAAALAETRGGRNLTAIGLARDLASVARIDSVKVAPCLDLLTRSIRPLGPI